MRKYYHKHFESELELANSLKKSAGPMSLSCLGPQIFSVFFIFSLSFFSPSHIYAELKSLQQIEEMMQKAGKSGIIEEISANRGRMSSIQDDGRFVTFAGEGPNEDLITALSIAIDFEKIGKSPAQFEQILNGSSHRDDQKTNQPELERGQKKPVITAGSGKKNSLEPTARFQIAESQANRGLERTSTDALTENQQLLDACRNADFRKIKVSIEAGADVNCRNARGNTPLILFLKVGLKAWSKKDPVEVVKYLLENGADIEARNQGGESALHLAIHSKNIRLIDYLIEQGADLTREAHIISFMAIAKNYELIEFLASRGISLDELWIDNPALIHAYQRRDYKMVKLLLKLGADPCVKGQYNQTVLMWAASSGDYESFDTVLSSCGPENVTARNDRLGTALHFAARAGRPKHVKRLLDYGAEIEARSDIGRTALHESAANRSPFVVSDYIEAIRILLAAGADINAVNKVGATPLFLAAEYGFADVIGQLVAEGADVFHQTKSGRSAVWKMALRGHKEAINELCTQKSKAGQDNVLQHERTPVIHEAIIRNNPETALVLVECGANIEMPDRTGETPLMAAAARNNAYEVLLKLIDSGADIDARDKSGKTALRHAIFRRNDAAATALIEAGALVD